MRTTFSTEHVSLDGDATYRVFKLVSPSSAAVCKTKCLVPQWSSENESSHQRRCNRELLRLLMEVLNGAKKLPKATSALICSSIWLML